MIRDSDRKSPDSLRKLTERQRQRQRQRVEFRYTAIPHYKTFVKYREEKVNWRITDSELMGTQEESEFTWKETFLPKKEQIGVDLSQASTTASEDMPKSGESPPPQQKGTTRSWPSSRKTLRLKKKNQ